MANEIKPIMSTERQLQNIYGHKGFDVKSLYRHMQFATLFPDSQIVSTASRQLSWSHFVELLPLKDELKRDYYFTLASANRWSVRQLRKEIDGMLYERTALSSKPEEQIELLQLDKSGIKVAQYMTELPPRDVLVQQIQKSLEVAKAKWGNERKEDEV